MLLRSCRSPGDVHPWDRESWTAPMDPLPFWGASQILRGVSCDGHASSVVSRPVA